MPDISYINGIPHIPFTEEMKRDYTILVPNMLEIHFRMIINIFNNAGYHVELLTTTGPHIATEGLKYVHNDTCYPALLVIGQMIDALKSGKYDLNKTALMITQTGGGCRASNYIHLLRKSLVKAGLPQVPVLSLNLSGLEKDASFKMTLPILRKCVVALAYGDLLMLMKNQIMPYELKNGETMETVNRWADKLTADFAHGRGLSAKEIKANMFEMAAELAKIKVNRVPKVKVGIVGEIYVKYSPLANNGLEDFLHTQDCEVMVPGIMGFMMFKVDNRLEDIKLYGGSKIKYMICRKLLGYFMKIDEIMCDAVRSAGNYVTPASYPELKKMVDGIIGYGSKMGEGWLLTAEMVELIHHGYSNIVCAQPFGCLPNHIVGKGMIRKLRTVYPDANIVPVDYDPGATKVNQENRIKLMLAVGAERLPGTGAGTENAAFLKESLAKNF
ncbi:MAG: 2-hydroxyglutaryl-CoA dehydratase [Eubacteriales bacterium]